MCSHSSTSSQILTHLLFHLCFPPYHKLTLHSHCVYRWGNGGAGGEGTCSSGRESERVPPWAIRRQNSWPQACALSPPGWIQPVTQPPPRARNRLALGSRDSFSQVARKGLGTNNFRRCLTQKTHRGCGLEWRRSSAKASSPGAGWRDGEQDPRVWTWEHQSVPQAGGCANLWLFHY